MNIDISSLRDQMNDIVYNLKVYFSTLSQNEIYAWVGVVMGFVLIILGLIML